MASRLYTLLSNITNRVNNTYTKDEVDSLLQNKTLPVGSITLFGSLVVPTGWLLCNGQAVSRTLYPELFDAIGIAFGVGDGSTTFNLPNYQNNVPIGAGGTYTLGSSGGEATHLLTVNEIPSHNHKIGDGSSVWVSKYGSAGAASGANWPLTTMSATASSTGGSQPHNNLPPYLAINYIIKVAY